LEMPARIGLAIASPRVSDSLPARAWTLPRLLPTRAKPDVLLYLDRSDSVRPHRLPPRDWLVATAPRTGPPPRQEPSRRRYRSVATASGPGRRSGQVSYFIFSPSISMPSRSPSPASTSCSGAAVVQGCLLLLRIGLCMDC
jgi:hypothetical protein